MPLPLPTLDRLTYDELVSEGRSSLPALAPGWTDYNAHDPGITLLELFAWLAEGSSYRLDNIPDESYRAFLRLAGVVPRPAQVAETLLVFRTSCRACALPAGVRVQSPTDNVVFQTTHRCIVSDAKLQAVVSAAGRDFEDVTVRNKTTAQGSFTAWRKAEGRRCPICRVRPRARARGHGGEPVACGPAMRLRTGYDGRGSQSSRAALEDEAARLCQTVGSESARLA